MPLFVFSQQPYIMRKTSTALGFLFMTLLSFAQDTTAKKKPMDYFEYLKSEQAKMVGKKFPDFAGSSTNATTVKTKDISGKIVFVNFWFAACTPCMAEMKALNQLYDSLKNNNDFYFLSISYDPDSVIKKTIKKFNIQYPVVHVSQAETKRLNFAHGYPTSFILDRNGIIKFFSTGATIEEDGNIDILIGEVYPRILEELKK